MQAFRRWMVASMFLVASGCYGWKTRSTPVTDLVADTDNEAIRVTVTQGAKISLHHPRLVRDTIYGNPSSKAIRTIKVPLSEVTSVATRSRSIPRTLLLGLAIVGAFLTYELVRADNSSTF